MPIRRLNPHAGKAVNLLYVEDDDVNWAVAELALEKKYSLTRAKDAEETFTLLNNNPFDAILMDIELAGSDLNGIEVVRIIKGTYDRPPPSYARIPDNVKELPIIFMTAYSARYSRAELLAVGGSELVTKPVNFTALALALTRMVLRKI